MAASAKNSKTLKMPKMIQYVSHCALDSGVLLSRALKLAYAGYTNPTTMLQERRTVAAVASGGESVDGRAN